MKPINPSLPAWKQIIQFFFRDAFRRVRPLGVLYDRRGALPMNESVTPQPGDILIDKGSGGSLFIYLVPPTGKPDWKASSTAMLRQRGVSRIGRQNGLVEDNYQPAPDFTAGRVFGKGQAPHLIRKYLPELAADEHGPRRILLRGQFFYTQADEKPPLPMRRQTQSKP